MYPLKTKIPYNPSNLKASANTFTTVYLGNYISGNYDENVGSHCWVDIFPVVKHDNVFACLDGVVQVAENKGANGNYVVIKHDNVPDPTDTTQKTTLYSCYLHLTEYSVTAGQLVSEGDVIGKCGNTGNVSGSTGEHLHFQIDRSTAPFHPYWPFTFAEAQAAGLGFFEAVNKWLGIANARKFTVSPLVYLDRVAEQGSDPITVSSTLVASAAAVADVAPVSHTSPQPTSSVAGGSSGFSDVPSGHPYAVAINFLKDKWTVSGNDGQFFPDATITRAELLKMVFGAAGTVLVKDGQNYFSDIYPTSWQAAYANTAKVRNVIGGYPDGTFRPNNSITRAEAFKIVINTFHSEPLDTVSFPVFDDVSTDAWYASYANFAKTAELMDFSGNSFEPDRFITRGEVANALYVLMK